MNYHNILYDDMRNGDGLRVVLFLSSCHHQCFNCQNPQTWDPKSGIEFDIKAHDEIIKELSKEYISGITLTGGDPLAEENIDGVIKLVEEIRNKFPNKTIWLYTGYTIKQINTVYEFELAPSSKDYVNCPDYVVIKKTLEDKKRSKIISLCDVVIDGKYIDKLGDIALHWKGSSNQRVIDVKKTLKKGEVVLFDDN